MQDFEELYRRYAKQLLRYLVCLSGDRQLAEELLQETFYQVQRRFEGFDLAVSDCKKRVSQTRNQGPQEMDDLS